MEVADNNRYTVSRIGWAFVLIIMQVDIEVQRGRRLL